MIEMGLAMIVPRIAELVAAGVEETGNGARPAPPRTEALHTIEPSDRIVPAGEIAAAPSASPFDELRQTTVAIWARALLIERTIRGRRDIDPRLLADLASIHQAVVDLSQHLDDLEDAFPRRAA